MLWRQGLGTEGHARCGQRPILCNPSRRGAGTVSRNVHVASKASEDAGAKLAGQQLVAEGFDVLVGAVIDADDLASARRGVDALFKCRKWDEHAACFAACSAFGLLAVLLRRAGQASAF